jgi:hypothetical protein
MNHRTAEMTMPFLAPETERRFAIATESGFRRMSEEWTGIGQPLTFHKTFRHYSNEDIPLETN